MSDDALPPPVHRGDVPTPGAPPDPSLALNFLPNASPLTGVVVQMLRNVAADSVDLKVCRVRDSWLQAAGLPMLNLLVELGGDLRGGSNGALWNRIRAHPWYASDEDSSIPKMARVVFAIRDQRVRACAAALSVGVPKTCVSPEQKLRDSIDRHMRRADAAYPARVPLDQAKYLMVAFVDACTRARTEP